MPELDITYIHVKDAHKSDGKVMSAGEGVCLLRL